MHLKFAIWHSSATRFRNSQGGMKTLDNEHFGCRLPAVHFAWYFSFAVIMSEIHPTDHDSITARNFPEEGFSEADGEFCWVEKDYKLVEAKFSKVLSLIFSELNKQEDCVHTVCCLVPVNIERIQDHQAIHSTPLNFLQLPFRIRNLVLES